MATLTAVQVQQIFDSALKQGNVIDYIGPLFQTIAGSNAARAALNTYPITGLTEPQKAAICRCATASSRWMSMGQGAAVDANNVGVLQSLLGAIAASSQASQTGGLQLSGNLIAALAGAIS